VVPADRILETPNLNAKRVAILAFDRPANPMPTNPFTTRNILDHVFVGFIGSIDACLGALDGQGERVHDDKRRSDDFALHKTHNFIWNTGPGVDHLLLRGVERQIGGANRDRSPF